MRWQRALTCALLLAGCAPGGSIDPGDAKQVARGEAVYREHCASCHGARLEGQPDWRQRRPNGRLPAPPHDASGHTWHHPNELLINIVRQGMVPPWAPAGYDSDMPAFGGHLSDADILAVLAYIQSTWPPEVREQRARMLQQGRP
ncbi:cytochrome c [Azoarcus sp. KH32C]|uniref:c-type cytochrome n=1 Tax=Azoarcus sp. KH32C TaxID=748247 RepID=UPI0003481962|nr:cytochrome c [Azoarcus sp. KH32C]